MEIYRSPVEIENGAYAKGTRIKGANGFVFLSGSVGMDTEDRIPETIGGQTMLAMKNLKRRLEEYGSSLENILFVRTYLKGDFPDGIINDSKFRECSAVMQDFWKEHCPEFLRQNNPPASTLIGVTSLARAEFLIEIEVKAAIP